MLLISNNCTALDGERKQSCGYIFHVLFHVKNSLLAGRKTQVNENDPNTVHDNNNSEMLRPW